MSRIIFHVIIINNIYTTIIKKKIIIINIFDNILFYLQKFIYNFYEIKFKYTCFYIKEHQKNFTSKSDILSLSFFVVVIKAF